MRKIDFESIEDTLKESGLTAVLAEAAADAQPRPLVIAEIPEEWWAEFRSFGFTEYVDYRDLWLNQLTPDETQRDYDFLQMAEYLAAYDVYAACEGQSRGFEGYAPEWFLSWLRGEDAGLQPMGGRDAAILVHRVNGRVVGISCTATYAHGHEKGAVVWERMLAVHPEFQGRGIGRKLLLQTHQYGVEHGASRCFLAVDSLNANAARLYADVGFRPREGERQVDMILYR